MMEIWASIDLMKGNVVRLIKGNPENAIIYSSSPLEIALKLQDFGIDGLHIVDLDAALNQGNNTEIIYQIAKNVKVPLQVAGGIRSMDKVKEVLNYVNRVVVGTLIYDDKIDHKQLLKFGEERIIVAIDHRNGKVNIEGWKKQLELELSEAISKFLEYGYKLFMITNIAYDGTLEGINLYGLEKINKDVLNRIYVAGGTRSIKDLIEVKKKGLRGIIIGRAIYEGLITKNDILRFKYELS